MNLLAEEKFLLLYARTKLTEEMIQTARMIPSIVLDWSRILEMTRYHEMPSFVEYYQIAPLLYWNLSQADVKEDIPGSVLQELKKAYDKYERRNTLLYKELRLILEAFNEVGIEVIVLKGAALAELVYQNIALRPMGDVDLLVKGKDIWRIDKVLSQLGYESNVTSLLSKRHVQWIQHITYTNRVPRVEVHPKIYELPNLNPWINASPATIASTDTLILGLEDFLLHLCLHVDRHLRKGRSTKLIWWCDIAEVLKHYRKELNWDYVIRIAKKHQVEGAIHRILHVINEGFDGHVPANVLSQLKDDGVIISINDVLHQKRVQTQNQELDSLLSSISRIPSIHNKIYHVFRSIFPCREFMIHRYDVTRPNCVYFYYFIRISKVAIKAVKALYQLPSYLKNKNVSLRT